jgi:hypothetical protein
LNRREFLVRATIGGVSVPLLVRQLGCDGDDGGPGPGDSREFSSRSPDGTGHSHSITIPDADLAAGDTQSYPTTVTDHAHTVEITNADFDLLKRGCRITKLSSTNNGHEHTWEILIAEMGSGFVETSLGDATGHTHTLTIEVADINSPPPLRNYDTSQPSSGNPHSHHVTLTETDFRALQACEIVDVTSNQADGHTHLFSISRP